MKEEEAGDIDKVLSIRGRKVCFYASGLCTVYLFTRLGLAAFLWFMNTLKKKEMQRLGFQLL